MDSQGILQFILKNLVPIVLAVVGLILISGSRKGKMSDTLNTTAIAVIGIVFIVGAAGFIAFGEQISKTVFTGGKTITGWNVSSTITGWHVPRH